MSSIFPLTYHHKIEMSRCLRASLWTVELATLVTSVSLVIVLIQTVTSLWKSAHPLLPLILGIAVLCDVAFAIAFIMQSSWAVRRHNWGVKLLAFHFLLPAGLFLPSFHQLRILAFNHRTWDEIPVTWPHEALSGLDNLALTQRYTTFKWKLLAYLNEKCGMLRQADFFLVGEAALLVFPLLIFYLATTTLDPLSRFAVQNGPFSTFAIVVAVVALILRARFFCSSARLSSMVFKLLCFSHDIFSFAFLSATFFSCLEPTASSFGPLPTSRLTSLWLGFFCCTASITFIAVICDCATNSDSHRFLRCLVSAIGYLLLFIPVGFFALYMQLAWLVVLCRRLEQELYLLPGIARLDDFLRGPQYDIRLGYVLRKEANATLYYHHSGDVPREKLKQALAAQREKLQDGLDSRSASKAVQSATLDMWWTMEKADYYDGVVGSSRAMKIIVFLAVFFYSLFQCYSFLVPIFILIDRSRSTNPYQLTFVVLKLVTMAILLLLGLPMKRYWKFLVDCALIIRTPGNNELDRKVVKWIKAYYHPDLNLALRLLIPQTYFPLDVVDRMSEFFSVSQSDAACGALFQDMNLEEITDIRAGTDASFS